MSFVRIIVILLRACLLPRAALAAENAPVPREVEPPTDGAVIAIPQVGGLHHRYTRAA